MRTLPLSALLATIILAACTSEAQQQPVVTTTPSSSEAATMSSATSVTTETPPTVTVSERMQSGGILQIGSSKAKVSMLLFINYSSEYSQEFHNALVPQLMKDYVETGKIQLGMVPMQFAKYPESNKSTGLLVCATLQGKGRLMNDLLFSKTSPAELQKRIADMGLSIDQLKDCLGNEPMKKNMDAEAELIQSFGITTVPSYSINGDIHTGLPEYADLRAQIEKALSE